MTVSLSLPRCNSFDGGTAFDFDASIDIAVFQLSAAIARVPAFPA
jgi:hypothetical protein